jgi:hypothetical protein
MADNPDGVNGHNQASRLLAAAPMPNVGRHEI